MKKLTALKLYAAAMTVVCLCLAGVYVQHGRTTEEQELKQLFAMKQLTFRTPEEAIRHYEEGMRQNDLHMILEACAVEELDVDFAEMIGNIGGYSINVSWPGRYPLSNDMNKITGAGGLVFSLKNMIWSLKLPDVDAGYVLSINSEDGLVKDPERFQQLLDCTGLSGLKIERIQPLENPEQEAALKTARSYGAEDQREFVLLYSLDGRYYAGGVTLYQIGGGWKIRYLYANSSGISFSGELEPVTPEKFEQLFVK